MKKGLILVALIALTVVIQAQNNKVISAWKYLKDFNDFKEVSSLKKAKEAIDAAIENADTKVEAKTWLYRGNIYQTIFEQNFRSEIDKQKDVPEGSKKTTTAYQNTDIADLEKAYESYLKSKELDVKKEYTQELKKAMNEC
jgi:hypothetical protein